MKVILAGYNVDINELNKLKNSPLLKVTLTPETFSAAYARISRSPKHVNELRKIACLEVEKSREINKKIVFDMGHSSVAEHAVFNFDIIGISRLAVELLEKFRLCSYTEKSQRYITLEDDYIIPEEIKKDEDSKDIFKNTVFKQNEFYWKLYDKLIKYVFEKNKDLAKDEKNNSLLEGWAKEDARYITSLATECQLGMTLNCRNLELMIRRFASSDYKEINELGINLYDQVKDIAPSIIRYHKKNNYDSETYKNIKSFFNKKILVNNDNENEEVILVDSSSDIDNKILASLLHTVSHISFDNCLKKIKEMSYEEKLEFIKHSFKFINFYDSILREFEYGSFTFDMIVSASCFAQLKRHRMSTMTMQDYNPCLGITMPESISAINMEKEFMQIINNTNIAYERILSKCGSKAAQYVLTNSHRRRVLMNINVRELYHISRLREDSHAQWDIKNLTKKMIENASKKAELTLMLMCGKDKFSEKYNLIFGLQKQVI